MYLFMCDVLCGGGSGWGGGGEGSPLACFLVRGFLGLLGFRVCWVSSPGTQKTGIWRFAAG